MNIENPCYRRSSQKTKGRGLGTPNSAPLIAVVGNHPVFRWFASLYLLKLLLRMHYTSQGLILSLCSNQQHLYPAGMSKFDHYFGSAARLQTGSLSFLEILVDVD